MSDEPPMMTLDDYEEALEVELLAVENLENLLNRFVDATTTLTGEDYGEHSNLNDPWGNALVALHELASAPDKAELVQAGQRVRDVLVDIIEYAAGKRGEHDFVDLLKAACDAAIETRPLLGTTGEPPELIEDEDGDWHHAGEDDDLEDDYDEEEQAVA